MWGVAAPRDGWPCPKRPSCSEPTPGRKSAMSFALASGQPEAPQGRDGSGGAIRIQAVRIQLYLSQAFVLPGSPLTDTCTPPSWWEYLCLSLLQGADSRGAARGHYPHRVGLQNWTPPRR